MNPVRFLIIASIALCFVASTVKAQTVAEARELIETGECDEAIGMLEKIVSSKPKDADASYYLGMAYLCTGDKQKAIDAFLSAKKKGSRDAAFNLARLYLERYEIEDAEVQLADYRKLLKKAKKGTVDLSEGFDEKLDKINTMLDRVEKIVVVDSICVEETEFFKFYDMAKETGSLSSPSVLGDKVPYSLQTVVFETGDKRERIWAIENDDLSLSLVSAGPTYGGNWSDPVVLGNELGEGGDANYPFLMADGVTMYFANDGENSIGGYDIFLTRRDGDRFLEPTNVGFPYNSPADDYLLVIDEIRNLGWWATKRNAPADSIVIYTFIPSDTRENYSYDDPSRMSYARIDNYRDTWNGKDYTQKKTDKALNRGGSEPVDFVFSFQGKTYNTLEQFKNSKARQRIQQYFKELQTLEQQKEKLESLRVNYKQTHSKAIARQILDLEQDILRKEQSLKKLKNEVISLETLQK